MKNQLIELMFECVGLLYGIQENFSSDLTFYDETKCL